MSTVADIYVQYSLHIFCYEIAKIYVILLLKAAGKKNTAPLRGSCFILFVRNIKVSGRGTAPRHFLYPPERRAVFVPDYHVVLLHVRVQIGNVALRNIRARIFDCYRPCIAVYKHRFDNEVISSFNNVSHNQITLSFVTFVTP